MYARPGAVVSLGTWIWVLTGLEDDPSVSAHILLYWLACGSSSLPFMARLPAETSGLHRHTPVVKKLLKTWPWNGHSAILTLLYWLKQNIQLKNSRAGKSILLPQ